MTKHGHSKRANGKPSPTYVSWTAMKSRCLRVNDPKFFRYGGRGITVDPVWNVSFAAFLAEMGERPQGMTLDRRDNNGPYTPGNCRWATNSTQSLNRPKTGGRPKTDTCPRGHMRVERGGRRVCKVCAYEGVKRRRIERGRR